MGDTVTSTIRVFNLGVAVDPTTLSVYISGAEADRTLAYTPTGVGTYVSTFQIQPGDLAGLTYGGSFDTVNVNVNATFADTADDAVGYLSVWAIPAPLAVALVLPATRVAPGGEAFVNATVSSYGAPTDPDTLTVAGGLLSPQGALAPSFPILMARIRTGSYSGVYHAPITAEPDSTLIITGMATQGSRTAYAWSRELVVGYPHSFTIWEHVRAVTPSYSLVDILVGNETAWPVEGANVSLYYPSGTCTGSGCQPPRWMHATTDHLGAASFNLTYPYYSFSLSLPFSGNVTDGGPNQFFAGGVYASPAYAPYRDFCPSGGLLSYAPGDTVRRTYYAACGYGGASPTYYYSVYTPQSVIANGSVQAGSGGNFTLSFAAPAEDVRVDILNNLTFGGWARYRDTVWVANPALTAIANLSIGRVAQITVDLSNVSGSVQFLPYNASSITNPELSSWVPLSCCNPAAGIPAAPGSPFHADLVLPRFLPKDRDYLLTVSVNGSVQSPGYVFSKVVHVANLPPVPTAAFSSHDLAVGEPVAVDASRSSDEDGVVTAYRFDWGDGNATGWRVWPNASHVYSTPGTYTAVVHVLDDSGAQNATTATIVVEPTVFGVRASVFYGATVVAVSAAVVAFAVAVVFRKRRLKTRESSGAEGPENAPEPPQDMPRRGTRPPGPG